MNQPTKRYAVRMIGSGQVLCVGLPPIEADAYVAAYNRIMGDRGQAVERVEVAWTLPASASCNFPTAADATKDLQVFRPKL